MFETEEQVRERNKKEFIGKIEYALFMILFVLVFFVPLIGLAIHLQQHPIFHAGDIAVLTRTVEVKQDWGSDPGCRLESGSKVKIQHIFFKEDPVLKETVTWVWVADHCEGWVNISNLKRVELSN